MYDKKRRKRELGHLRERLLRSAQGTVLELGVGAGANFPYYSRETAITAVDFSPAMLEKARAANERDYGLNVTFMQGDVDELTLPEQSFDTVVSTLSMCAYRNPADVLHKLHRWCRPGGRLLLLEHGLSANGAIAFAQRTLDPLAYRFMGCHHNRDMLTLVQNSPWELEKVERRMTGMLYLMWAVKGDERA
jgi:ubiquinone/menaquinone biosynthesis C-methylase UbiE